MTPLRRSWRSRGARICEYVINKTLTTALSVAVEFPERAVDRIKSLERRKRDEYAVPEAATSGIHFAILGQPLERPRGTRAHANIGRLPNKAADQGFL
jgi:hypothetical protein